jgi:hypothetical protein
MAVAFESLKGKHFSQYVHAKECSGHYKPQKNPFESALCQGTTLVVPIKPME